MSSGIHLVVALALGAASPVHAQEPAPTELADLEQDGARGLALTETLRERAGSLSATEAELLRSRLAAQPGDLPTRMTLIFYEEPAGRRQRGARNDPKPHGRLVLGLIEEHPRSNLAGTAGFLLYPYKRDGMYTGPAWDGAIELWERLVAAHPEDPAIACNAGAFGMADPFRWEQDGPRALVLLERARELAPEAPRYALMLGAYHAQLRAMTREPAARAAAARAAVPHLRAAWDLTPAAERPALDVQGYPLAMVLANALFDAGEPDPARTFALLALEEDDTEKPNGDLVYQMNIVLGRIALGAGDVDAAVRSLLAAGQTPGSAVLGSFGPKMTLARELLAVGRREDVLEFLARCRQFWPFGADKLDAWTRAITEGRDPWMERR